MIVVPPSVIAIVPVVAEVIQNPIRHPVPTLIVVVAVIAVYVPVAGGVTLIAV